MDTSAYGVSITAALVTANTPVSASFDWGDGTTTVSTNYTDGSTDIAVDHNYLKLGTYTVTVTVTDNLGNTIYQHHHGDHRGF